MKSGIHCARDLLSPVSNRNVLTMGLPTKGVELSPEDIAELHRKLGDLRHSVNNHLTLIATALELMRQTPQTVERVLATVTDQPQRIREDLVKFSIELERALGIARD